MTSANVTKQMIERLLGIPGYNIPILAKELGIQKRTLEKIQTVPNYDLEGAKQMALIRLYCSIQPV